MKYRIMCQFDHLGINGVERMSVRMTEIESYAVIRKGDRLGFGKTYLGTVTEIRPDYIDIGNDKGQYDVICFNEKESENPRDSYEFMENLLRANGKKRKEIKNTFLGIKFNPCLRE